jgi:hypothetical protein
MYKTANQLEGGKGKERKKEREKYCHVDNSGDKN